MYIAFEVDSVISSPVKKLTDRESIEQQTAIDGAKEVLDEIRKQGHQIVIYTKRDSSTALETEAWLKKNKMPYDQIIFGRARNTMIFFSPDSRQFVNWKGVKEELIRNGFLVNKKQEEEDKIIKTDLPSHDSQGSIQDLKK